MALVFTELTAGGTVADASSFLIYISGVEQ